jgi:hypothetical protein
LDTSEKIVPLQDLSSRLGDANWLAVVGYFDPLTLTQARRLAELSGRGRNVLTVVEPRTGSLLAVEARAALVAALRSVQMVVIAEAASFPAHPQIEIIEDQEGERERSSEFIQFIKRRQGTQ